MIVGLHEALSKLSRRDIALYMLFDGEPELLDALYRIGDDAANAVGVAKLRKVFYRSDLRSAAAQIAQETGLREEQILLLDAAKRHDLSDFKGYIHDGPISGLRRALLTDPKLRSRAELLPAPHQIGSCAGRAGQVCETSQG